MRALRQLIVLSLCAVLANSAAYAAGFVTNQQATPVTLAPADLDSSISSCQPTESPDNLLLQVWAFAGSSYTAVRAQAVHPSRTDKCLPSTLLLLTITEPETLDRIRLFESGVVVGLTTPYSIGADRCPPKETTCCQLNTAHLQCLLDFNVTPNSPPLDKIYVGAQFLVAFGREISKNSSFVERSSLSSFQFPGDQLIFLWPFIFTETDGKQFYLFTTLTADLAARIGAFTSRMMPTVRAVNGLSWPGTTAFKCDASGLRPVASVPAVPDRQQFDVSIGYPPALRQPSRLGFEYGYTLRFSSQAEVTYLNAIYAAQPPLGGGNRDWIEFSAFLREANTAFLPCFGPELSDAIKHPSRVRLFNAPESSVFFLSMVYLSALFAEITSTPVALEGVKLEPDTAEPF